MPRPFRLYFPSSLHKSFEDALPATETITCSRQAGYWPDEYHVRWELFVLKNGYRLVRNKKRAQKLARRGECMHWSDSLSGWIWGQQGLT